MRPLKPRILIALALAAALGAGAAVATLVGAHRFHDRTPASHDDSDPGLIP